MKKIISIFSGNLEKIQKIKKDKKVLLLFFGAMFIFAILLIIIGTVSANSSEGNAWKRIKEKHSLNINLSEMYLQSHAKKEELMKLVNIEEEKMLHAQNEAEKNREENCKDLEAFPKLKDRMTDYMRKTLKPDNCGCGEVKKKGWSKEASYWVQYAYNLSNCSKDFVIMLNAENGMWTHKRRHNPAMNTVGVDWGFCGVNDFFHPHIVKNPLFFSSQEWQMKTCLELFEKGTTFYGFTNKYRFNKSKEQIIFSH